MFYWNALYFYVPDFLHKICAVVISSVDTCVPGDMVTVCGIVKVTNADEGTHCLLDWQLDMRSQFDMKSDQNHSSSL